MIGGNIQATLQQKTGFEINGIGEKIQAWSDVLTLTGWLDLSSGDSKYNNDAKLQESTHIFLCDYTEIDRIPTDKRMIINGTEYDVLFIDDPMELHAHLEIFLKFVR